MQAGMQAGDRKHRAPAAWETSGREKQTEYQCQNCPDPQIPVFSCPEHAAGKQLGMGKMSSDDQILDLEMKAVGNQMSDLKDLQQSGGQHFLFMEEMWKDQRAKTWELDSSLV